MKILSIKRPSSESPTTGLKIYATVQGDEHNGKTEEYKIGYYRRAGFRGWMCSCTNFVLSKFGRSGHCKHIDHIQSIYGRYGAAFRSAETFLTFESAKVGQKVFVPAKINDAWTGNGIITRLSKGTEPIYDTIIVKMTSGRFKGQEGGFSSLQLVG